MFLQHASEKKAIVFHFCLLVLPLFISGYFYKIFFYLNLKIPLKTNYNLLKIVFAVVIIIRCAVIYTHS